jgi:hypothetical protein
MPCQKSTGPKTSSGKAVSSQNAIKHGCTSTRLLLPDENEAEWLALKARWLAEYQPDSPLYQDLVERAAQADWLLRRTAARYDEAEQQLWDTDPPGWSAEQHQVLERFLRYRTTAERGGQLLGIPQGR